MALALKKLRLEAQMTQSFLANRVGVTQPTYQRWESGAVPIPVKQLAKLCEALGVTADQIAGKPAPFDGLGVNKSIRDQDRKFYGELAVHFNNGKNMLLPISEGCRQRVWNQYQSDEHDYIIIQSLDNRLVAARIKDIDDLYFADEAADSFGPENYEGHLGIEPNDQFWRVIENIEDTDELNSEIDQTIIDEVFEFFNQKLDSQDDQKAHDARCQALLNRSITLEVLYNSGKLREITYLDDSEIYAAINPLIEGDDEHTVVINDTNSAHDIMFRMRNVTALTVPLHKYNQGHLKMLEAEID